MRRSLVLGDETAHHPFLQSLPPHVRSGRAPLRPMLIVVPQEPAPSRLDEAQDARRRWTHAAGHTLRKMGRRAGEGITAADLRLFLLAYCACFLAVSAFIW